MLQPAELAGLGWPLTADLDSAGSHERLYGRAAAGAGLRGDGQGVEPAQKPDVAVVVAPNPRLILADPGFSGI